MVDVSAAAQAIPSSREPDREADIERDRLAAVDELCSELVRFMHLVKRVAHRVGPGNNGVEFAAYALLGHIVCDGPMRTTALADVVHSDPSTVSRQVAALVRHGLLERKADPVDGRASLLVATTEGLKIFEEARRQRSVLLTRVLADWPCGDLQQLNGLLERLNSDCETSEYVLNARQGAPDPARRKS